MEPPAPQDPTRAVPFGPVVGVVLVAFLVAAAVVTLLVWDAADDIGGNGGGNGGGDATAPTSSAAGPTAASSDGYAVWDQRDDGSPVRWDPCSPIELVIDDAGAYPGFRRDVEVAAGQLREATGLELTVTGRVDEPPSGDRAPYQPGRYGRGWAPVLIAFAAPGEDGVALRDFDRGVATPIAVGEPGDRVYTSGQIVLNAEREDLEPGFEDRASSWGATVLHELAHILGLAHVDDPDQLLATYPGQGPVELGAGDRAGLAAVGATGGTSDGQDGCLEVPDPGPVEVLPPRRPERGAPSS